MGMRRAKPLTLLGRYRILRNYSEPMFLSARIVDKAIVVGIIMTLFQGMGTNQSVRTQSNVAAALFMWATQPSFGCASYLPTIMLERPLYYRERADGLYYSSTYYLSKVCVWEGQCGDMGGTYMMAVSRCMVLTQLSCNETVAAFRLLARLG